MKKKQDMAIATLDAKSMKLSLSDEGFDKDLYLLKVSGIASTPAVNSYGFKMNPAVYKPEILAQFMQTPVMYKNHQIMNFKSPVAKAVKVHADDAGLYFEALVLNNSGGRDLAIELRSDTVKGISVGIWYDDRDMVKQKDGTMELTAIERLLEISFADIQADPGAVVTGYATLSLNAQTNMKPEESNKEVASSHRKVGHMSKRQFTEEGFAELDNELNAKLSTLTVTAKESETALAGVTQTLKEMQLALTTGKDTDADINAKIDRMKVDLSNLSGQVTAATELIKERKLISMSQQFGVFNFKQFKNEKLLTIGRDKAIAMFKMEGAVALGEFQRVYDEVVAIDNILAMQSKFNEGSYHLQTKAERIKGLAKYQELKEIALALDTATATEGLELSWVEYSASLSERVRIEQRIVANLPQVQMKTATLKSPVLVTDAMGTLAGQVTAVISAFNTTETGMTFYQPTWTAKKVRVRQQFSNELTEDSLTAVMSIVMSALARGLARPVEHAVLNGATAGSGSFDSDDGAWAATDYRLAFDGLRKLTLAASKVDCGTFNVTNLRATRATMGRFGLNPADLMIIVSARTLLKNFMSLTEVSTVEKYGPQAVILTGQLAAFDGVPLIPSEFSRDDLNASGLAATGAGKSCAVWVHRPTWVVGSLGQPRTATREDIINDIWDGVGYDRKAFAALEDPAVAGNNSVAWSMNIA